MGKKDVYSGNLKRYLGGSGEESKAISHFFGRPLAMDMGSTNTRISRLGEGLVLDEPTVVAYEKYSKALLATGVEAKKFLGRTPQNIEVARPLDGGLVRDFDILQAMLTEFFLRVQRKKRFFKSRLLVCVPVNASSAEKKIIKTAARQAGIGRVTFIEEPMAAAIGMGLSVSKKKGQMVLDIGGSSVDLSLISNNRVVYGDRQNFGGDAMIRTIQKYMLDKHRLLIGDNSAEQCKLQVAGEKGGEDPECRISGKDSETSIPKEVVVQQNEVMEAIGGPLTGIVEMIKLAFEKIPPELKSDIMQDGIHITGGACQLRGITTYIEKQIKLKCSKDKEPRHGVIKGAEEVIAHRRRFKKVLLKK